MNFWEGFVSGFLGMSAVILAVYLGGQALNNLIGWVRRKRKK